MAGVMDLLLDRLRTLEEKNDDQHARLRSDVMARFDRLDGRFEKHQGEDDAIERRVFKMETERDIEARQVIKRSGLIAMAVSSVVGLSGLWLRWLTGK